MPNMVIPNEYKVRWLQLMLQQWDRGDTNPIVQLYRNNYVPVETSVAADFVEANFAGYFPKSINWNDFLNPFLDGNLARVVYDNTPVFTSTDPIVQTVYGWVMVDNDAGWAMAAQRFDAPRDMSTGAVLRIDPFRLALATLG